MRYVYLHGFASSSRSRKAQVFRAACIDRGIELEIPDLAEGDFENLTISRQLVLITELLHGDPAVLIGSSMGGYLAALYAGLHPEIDRLILLAPAFGLPSRWQNLIGPVQLRSWKQTGFIEVFHYGEAAQQKLSYRIVEDGAQYPDFPQFSQPVQIFHGLRDRVVPVELSRQFILMGNQRQLTELDSDHEMLNVLDVIVNAAFPK